jgi:hypothetical protein
MQQGIPENFEMSSKRQSLCNKVMSTEKETSHEEHLRIPHGKKDSTLNNKGNNSCTHCNMSGHWNDKCWKFHLELRKNLVKEPMQKKVANVTVKQAPIIQEEV